MIDDADISIVVQGPIFGQSTYYITPESTKIVCERLRDLFPKSEIILSGSIGNNVEGIIHDKLVLSEDPGATWFDIDLENNKVLNNCNRMIVSTLAGIKAASRKYVFKIRSDLLVVSKDFLDYFNKYPYYDEKYKFVKNRIIAFSIFSIKAEYVRFKVSRPYHISDWAYFGFKEDLLNMYDIPLTDEPEFSQYFLNNPKNYEELFPNRIWKMSPEQYVTSSFFNKFIKVSFNNPADISNNNEQLSETLIANNFLVLDQDQFHLISLKHLYLQILYEPILASTAIFFRSWLNDYHKYCKVPEDIHWLWQKVLIVQQSVIYIIMNKILRILNKKYYLYSWHIARKIKKICLKYK
jgi:hypothetical protein